MATSTESSAKTLYITRYHAQQSDDFTSSVEEGHDEALASDRKSIFNWFSLGRLKEFKIGSTGSGPLVKYKGRSIIVSVNGEYVAVLNNNRITVLSKEDNFMETVRTFSAFTENTVFIHGIWVDNPNVLIVSDNSNNVYFFQPFHKELQKIAHSHIEVAGTIVGFVVQMDKKISDSYKIGIIASSGTLQWVSCVGHVMSYHSQNYKATYQSQLRKCHPLGLYCCDFNRDLLTVTLAGPAKMAYKEADLTRMCSLSVWKLTYTTELELVCNVHVEGVLTCPKKYPGPLCTPKVILSPCGNCVALLDLKGDLHIVPFNEGYKSISEISRPLKNATDFSNENTKVLGKVVDFSWWSKGKILVAKADSDLALVDVDNLNSLFEETPSLSYPIFGLSSAKDGEVFILESIYDQSQPAQSSKIVKQTTETLTGEEVAPQTGWRVVSLSEVSVLEMYRILIDMQRFEFARHFAIKYNLDKDDVYKAEWLHSDYSADSVHKILSNIKDRTWVLSECVKKVGSTVDSVHAILSHGLSLTEDCRFENLDRLDYDKFWHLRMARLRLLQYTDRLETFLGINMGRFSSTDYSSFRKKPLLKVAINLSERGKIGSVTLLLKRHPFSLSRFILKILSCIPETVSVHSYSQILPGLSPFPATSIRCEDWVENAELLTFIETKWHDSKEDIDPRTSTEHMVKLHTGMLWPSSLEIIEWYKERARMIDRLSGQLENCLTLLDAGYNKGFVDLRPLFDETADLCRLVFSGGEMSDRDIDLSLSTWEQLDDYEKFKIMLSGVTEATVVDRLRELAIPFMHRKFSREDNHALGNSNDKRKEPFQYSDSFLVKWLKEVSEDDALELCSVVLEEGCRDTNVNWLFKNEIEMIEVGLHCVYACTYTDRWSLMASILSKLPRKHSRGHSFANFDEYVHENRYRGGSIKPQKKTFSSMPSNASLMMRPIPVGESLSAHEQGDNILDALERRLKLADGHVEAGRLLAQYQVPKPIRYFREAHNDESGVKQLVRLLLSKFGRRQPGRSDSDWAMMWRDLLSLQEKAFPFLDTEYLLSEFCRGLLKAGKFSLARNYLRGTASTSLTPEKAEMLVIQAAHEYFFSASSLDSSEIWKAKECLELFPNSKQVKAEADIIEAITVKLPRLGVTLLPMQFRQIRDPMDIVKMAINSQSGAYLKPDELIELACLLGLNSSDEIAMVEAAIAREAVGTGDFQLAADLCLLLVRKNYGPIWDLCAALARAPDIEKMDLHSRKELLGFALCYCDNESIGDLLHVWKELDIATQCESLITNLEKKTSTVFDQETLETSFPIKRSREILNLIKSSQRAEINTHEYVQNDENVSRKLRENLLRVSERFSQPENFDWDGFVNSNKKFIAFAALQLPWLLELHATSLNNFKDLSTMQLPFPRESSCIRTSAAAIILYWLANNSTLPRDELIKDFAHFALTKPVMPEHDILGCSYLLNLSNAHLGVAVIDKVLQTRKDYQDIQSAIKIGLLYSALQSSSKHTHPKQRKRFLQNTFWEFEPIALDFRDGNGDKDNAFWMDWRSRIEEQQKLAGKVRTLEQVIPGVDTQRFLSGDAAYIRSMIFALAEVAKSEKKNFLYEALILADLYGVKRSEVFVEYLSSLLVSMVWTNEEVESEILKHSNEIFENALLILQILPSKVYQNIDASDKQRLVLFFRILALCYKHTEEYLQSATSSENKEDLKNELINFIKAMIYAGYPFGILSYICFQGKEITGIHPGIESDYHVIKKYVEIENEEKGGAMHKHQCTLQIIQEAYVSTVNSALSQLCLQLSNESSMEIDKPNAKALCRALSSLAYMFGDDDKYLNDYDQQDFTMLNSVREKVWSKLLAFAEDMQLPKQIRVFVLELLQCITGRSPVQNVDLQGYLLKPWKGWNASPLKVEMHSTKENKLNVECFETTLIALKSTELVSALWHQKEITGEDLLTIDSAISLFFELANYVTSKEHILTLQSLLKEWQIIFGSEKTEYLSKTETETTKTVEDDWKDEWDEGWETFPDEQDEPDERSEMTLSINSLHSCWMLIFEKFIEQGHTTDVLHILDQSALSTCVLLTEDEVEKFVKLLVTIDPGIALKVALLFPYSPSRAEALKVMNDHLTCLVTPLMTEQEKNIDFLLDFKKLNLLDDGLLALILSAGLVPTLVNDSSFRKFFFCMCASMGQLARSLQEGHLHLKNKETQLMHQQESCAFSRVAFPYFIAELTRAKQFYLAGTFVFHFMHVHTVLSSLNATHSLLRRYLEIQNKINHAANVHCFNNSEFSGCLKNTMASLSDRLPSALKIACSTLSHLC